MLNWFWSICIKMKFMLGFVVLVVVVVVVLGFLLCFLG